MVGKPQTDERSLIPDSDSQLAFAKVLSPREQKNFFKFCLNVSFRVCISEIDRHNYNNAIGLLRIQCERLISQGDSHDASREVQHLVDKAEKSRRHVFSQYIFLINFFDDLEFQEDAYFTLDSLNETLRRWQKDIEVRNSKGIVWEEFERICGARVIKSDNVIPPFFDDTLLNDTADKSPVILDEKKLEDTARVTPEFEKILDREMAIKALRIAIKESGLSQRKFAEKHDMVFGTLTNILAGKATIDQTNKVLNKAGYALQSRLIKLPSSDHS